MVFDRKKYKDFAKKQLKGRWLVPVLITLTIFVIGEIFNIPDYVRIFRSAAGAELMSGNFSDLKEYFTLLSEATNSTGSTIADFIMILISSVLEVAALNVYLKMSRSPEKVSYMNFIESLNNWLRAILATLWSVLWVFLWTLLFIIPGFIKAISYSQIYYLINEYENLSVRKALKISQIITKGHKGDLFVTYLSFLGWGILCFLSLGIGTLWLRPYMNMTLINAYHAMMKDALETGLIRPEDLQ